MTSEINEVLWYGFGSDEEAEANAAKSLAGRVGRIVGAKPFPLAARRLAQVTKNPECSIDDVVKVLEYDPALSARLLRLVNSAGFALRTACTSVRHAAALVGLERINQVAVTAAIMDMYTPGNKLASKILEHTTVVGALSRYLGFHFDLDVEEMFTCGFLHDIGKLMMLDTEGEEYGELLTKAGFKEHDALHLLEREQYGFDHALLGGHVLSAWNIPDPIPKVVAWHHNVTRAYAHSSQVAQPTSVLRLADALSYALCSTQSDVEIEKIAHMEAASYLDISEPQIAAMWTELQTIEQRARLVFRDGNADPAEIFSFRPSRSNLRQRSFAPAKQDTPRTSKPVTPFPSNPPSSASTPVTASVEEPPLRLSTTPRKTSDPPAVLLEQTSIQPKQFPCVVCAGPSYANTCPACGGYACPEHQEGPDEWCSLCLKEYKEFGTQLLSVRGSLIGTAVGAACTGVLFAATGVASGGPLKVIGGSLLILLLALVLAVVCYGWIRRSWFLRSCPNRTSDDDTPHVSLDRVTAPQVEALESVPLPAVSLAPSANPALDAVPSIIAPLAATESYSEFEGVVTSLSPLPSASLRSPPARSASKPATAPASDTPPVFEALSPSDMESVPPSANPNPEATALSSDLPLALEVASPTDVEPSTTPESVPEETLEPVPSLAPLAETASPGSLLSMPDPLFESIDAHVFSSLPPRSFTLIEKCEAADATGAVEPETTVTIEGQALALLTNIQPSVPPSNSDAMPNSAAPELNAPALSDAILANVPMTFAAQSLTPSISDAPLSVAPVSLHAHSVAPAAFSALPMPHISRTPTLPMPFALQSLAPAASVEPIAPNHPLSVRPRSLAPAASLEATAPNVPVTHPPCSIPSGADVNPTAPTSRPPPPSDAELTDFYSVMEHSLPPNSRSPHSLSTRSLPPNSLSPVSFPPNSNVNATAPTSRPPSMELEVNPYLLLSSPAMSWAMIAESHGAAAGW